MSTMPLEDLRTTIVEAFERSGMTQQQLADASRVHYVTISRFLRSERGFTFALAGKVAGALGLEVFICTSKKVVDTA